MWEENQLLKNRSMTGRENMENTPRMLHSVEL